LNIELLTVLLIGSLLLLLAFGVPVFVALGSVAIVYSFFLWGTDAFFVIPTQLLSIASSPVFVAVPMFLLMANMLLSSGVADALFETMYSWMGSIRGGLAMGTVLICTVFAAMSGVSGVATISMGLIALPAMLKRKYDKKMALGCIAAGGVLGIVIPPSVEMVLYAQFCNESVGGMFAGGIIPGILCSALYVTYIGIRSAIQPQMGPAMPPEERVSLNQKIIDLKSVILPLLLVVAVLGSIYSGAATATEAASIGALGSFVCAAVYRHLNWKVVNDALRNTFKLFGLCVFIGGSAIIFNSVYTALGGQNLASELVSTLPINPWAILIFMQITLFLLGMVMDDYAVIMLVAPIYAPIVKTLGFDTLWWGVLFILNMQVAYLTPPYGFNLFYLRSIAPQSVTMDDIYRSILPFVGLQVLGLLTCMIFPQLILWLPSVLVTK